MTIGKVLNSAKAILGLGQAAVGYRLPTLAVLAMAAMLAAAPATTAVADATYPNRAVRIIVPFLAGGTVDLLTRMVAERLAAKWGQPVVVENRIGAAGNIGTEAAARAEPDGYTLLVAPPPTLVINQALGTKLSYDPAAFMPVTVVGAAPNVLAINPSVPVANIAELVTYAKANPDKLTFATTGPTSMLQLSMDMLRVKTGIEIRYISYARGIALLDLITGRVDMTFYPLGDLRSHLNDGKLRPLAVASEHRLAELPNVPTVAELVPNFHFDIWYALVAPPKTPEAIVEKVSATVAEILRDPTFAARLRDLAVLPIGGSPADTGAFFKREVERWREVVSATGAKPDRNE